MSSHRKRPTDQIGQSPALSRMQPRAVLANPNVQLSPDDIDYIDALITALLNATSATNLDTARASADEFLRLFMVVETFSPELLIMVYNRTPEQHRPAMFFYMLVCTARYHTYAGKVMVTQLSTDAEPATL